MSGRTPKHKFRTLEKPVRWRSSNGWEKSCGFIRGMSVRVLRGQALRLIDLFVKTE
jgi:hypothetical protein